jgi:UDP-N-acetylglucosamine acyltransferase
MIHPTAIIDPRAELAADVEVGPYAVIDAMVVLGPACGVGPHVHLTGRTRIGAGNVFHTGCVIGGASQDLKSKDEPTGLRIGDHNIFREHVTVNRSSMPEEDTVLGHHNLLMAGSHVGHNTVIGNFVRLANGALLGGHVTLEDHAIISGNALVHQFVRVGTLAMMQGGAAVSKDLPPYTMARGDNGICGLNIVGLRRAGVSSEQRLELKRAYRFLFRGALPLRAAAAAARAQFTTGPARHLVEFVAASQRGVCADVGRARTESPADP